MIPDRPATKIRFKLLILMDPGGLLMTISVLMKAIPFVSGVDIFLVKMPMFRDNLNRIAKFKHPRTNKINKMMVIRYSPIINSNLEIITEESSLRLSVGPISRDSTRRSREQCWKSCPELHSCSGRAQSHRSKLCNHWRQKSCRSFQEQAHILHCLNYNLRNMKYIVHWRCRRPCRMVTRLSTLHCS